MPNLPGSTLTSGDLRMHATSEAERSTTSGTVPRHVLSELWEEVVFRRGENWGRVISSSMWPLITKGDRVLVEKTSWDRVRFGDIIVFRRAGNLAVHRALGKRTMSGKAYLLEKGDAILWSTLVPAEDLVGRASPRVAAFLRAVSAV